MTTKGDRPTREQLAKLFASLGAAEPDHWAASQIEEGIPQLGRYLFLRQAWKQVIAAHDDAWMRIVLEADPSSPGGAGSEALKRMLAAGILREDITALVRTMQWHLLFAFCYLLDDPGELESDVATVGWSLFQTDLDGNPVIRLSGLHESLLETEPTSQKSRST